jgi:hypothetical protein
MSESGVGVGGSDGGSKDSERSCGAVGLMEEQLHPLSVFRILSGHDHQDHFHIQCSPIHIEMKSTCHIKSLNIVKSRGSFLVGLGVWMNTICHMTEKDGSIQRL